MNPFTPSVTPGAPFGQPGPATGAGNFSAADWSYGAPPVEAYQPPPRAYGQGPGYPAYGGYPAGARTNGLAIASLVCSLGGLVTCISAPVGIVLGHIARRQIRETGEDGAGLATAGLVIGYVFSGLGLLVLGFYLVLAVVFATGQS
jgi:Domain of unknown function (DUF4190)